MARRKIKRRKGKGFLAWRSRQKRGAIMKTGTFGSIYRRAKKKFGKKRAMKIAGKAYWRAAKAKYRKRRKK